ncbi:hypothetical protein T439DRAFT_332649 [Meredithblackwellia eburnea MCA 4105]
MSARPQEHPTSSAGSCRNLGVFLPPLRPPRMSTHTIHQRRDGVTNQNYTTTRYGNNINTSAVRAPLPDVRDPTSYLAATAAAALALQEANNQQEFFAEHSFKLLRRSTREANMTDRRRNNAADEAVVGPYSSEEDDADITGIHRDQQTVAKAYRSRVPASSQARTGIQVSRRPYNGKYEFWNKLNGDSSKKAELSHGSALDRMQTATPGGLSEEDQRQLIVRWKQHEALQASNKLEGQQNKDKDKDKDKMNESRGPHVREESLPSGCRARLTARQAARANLARNFRSGRY